MQRRIFLLGLGAGVVGSWSNLFAQPAVDLPNSSSTAPKRPLNDKSLIDDTDVGLQRSEDEASPSDAPPAAEPPRSEDEASPSDQRLPVEPPRATPVPESRAIAPPNAAYPSVGFQPCPPVACQSACSSGRRHRRRRCR